MLMGTDSEINQRVGTVDISDLNVEKKQLLKDEISECMRRLNMEENPSRSENIRPPSGQSFTSQPAAIRSSGILKSTYYNSGSKTVQNAFLNQIYHPSTNQPSIIPSANNTIEFNNRLDQLENATEKLMVDSDNLLF